jgi:sphingolipid delta-4 desaturase
MRWIDNRVYPERIRLERMMSAISEIEPDRLSEPEMLPGGFTPQFHWRILGTPAPVFPGFEIDICDRVSPDQEPDAVWHRARAKGILRDHPEVKQLFGPARISAAFCVFAAAMQITIACALIEQPWWMILLVAWCIGALVNIAIFNLTHECNHSLIFRSKTANRWLFTITSLPMLFPGHHTWWIEHHVHHNHLGSDKDFVKRRRGVLLALKDRIFGYLPGPRLRRMTTWITTPLFWPIAAFMLITQVLRAIFGLVVYAATSVYHRQWKPTDFALSILADEHLVSGYKRYKLEMWAVAYPLISLAMIATLFFFFGWVPLVYLFLSALFTTGFLHPLAFGLMLSNSHFHGHQCYQPSASNYGWVNWVTFNFGMHTEHHDFHYIPWFRLGRLREIAPEYYNDLKQTRSFCALAFQFAFGTRDAFNNEEYRNAERLQNHLPIA